MTVDSLEQLNEAFSEWRTRKRHLREEIPAELLRRARQTARAYGVNRVAREVKVDRRRLEGPRAGDGRGRGPAATPSYSRVELRGTERPPGAFAELEMPSGIKLRFYSQTPETMELLSLVCGTGGGQ